MVFHFVPIYCTENVPNRDFYFVPSDRQAVLSALNDPSHAHAGREIITKLSLVTRVTRMRIPPYSGT